MDIKTPDKKDHLFLSVNKDARGDGVFFPFLTALETKGRDMILHFGTYLAYKMSVFLYLKSNAAKRIAVTTWDDKKNKSISEDNKLLESIMNKTERID